jgi:hypothetical protein
VDCTDCLKPALLKRSKKEFIKLHIGADAESKKVVSFRVTIGNVHDAKKFCPLVIEASKKYNIDKVYAKHTIIEGT